MRNEEKYKADSVAKVKGDVIEFPIAGLPLMKTAEHLLARCPGAKFFPLTAGTKIPLSGSRGYLDATADLESLSEGVMYGDTGLAWVPGGLTEFVLDVDIKGDHHGATNLCRALGMNVPEGLTEAAAIDRLVDQLDTLMIQSPSGGLHIVLRHGLGHHVAWPTRPEGIDFRAGTGYLVMPNTALPEGTYTVIKDRPVAPAPETILAVLMPADDPAGADFGKLKLDLHPRTDSEEAINFAKERLKTIAPAAQGSHGDDRTVTVARWLYDWGIHPQTALDLMLEHWNDRCSPPWDADDLAVKIGSAYATSIRQGRKHGARIASGEDALGGYESTVDDFPAGVLSKRLASGDYRPPEWLEARPKAKDTIARPSSKHRAKVSFESIIAGWSREVVPKPNTVRTYESRLKFFTDVIGHRDASRVTSHDVRRWRDEMLEDGKLSRETIRDRLAAVNALLQWAVENEMLAENIAKDVKLRKRGAEGTRRTKREFTEEEAKLILRNARKKTGFLRWAPWIMAYTGMRVGEVAQLRRVDVVADGDGGLHLTVSPEAGNVKTGVERTIPVHPALIAEGFAEFANVGKTERLFPEFYRNLSKPRPPEDIAKAASYKMVRWLRGKEGLGITDLSISPSHSWRHFFNTLSRDAELDLEVRKAMVGHMDNKTAEGYGSVRMTAKRKQIEKLPAVKVD